MRKEGEREGREGGREGGRDRLRHIETEGDRNRKNTCRFYSVNKD